MWEAPPVHVATNHLLPQSLNIHLFSDSFYTHWTSSHGQSLGITSHHITEVHFPHDALFKYFSPNGKVCVCLRVSCVCARASSCDGMWNRNASFLGFDSGHTHSLFSGLGASSPCCPPVSLLRVGTAVTALFYTDCCGNWLSLLGCCTDAPAATQRNRLLAGSTNATGIMPIITGNYAGKCQLNNRGILGVPENLGQQNKTKRTALFSYFLLFF
jgi:hypothetical protein